MSIWTWGIDVNNQPLLDAWWTPGWTAQNKDYPQVPQNTFAAGGFPSGLTYVNVTGNFFDTMANPTSGYLTFWPSSALTFLVNGVTTYMPQRFSGQNQSMLGINQMSDSKIYLWYGQLSVTLLATDNANMTPAGFSYHVKEHYYRGLQYDILVPSSFSSTGSDIHSLIVPGSICEASEEVEQGTSQEDDRISIAVTSSQFLAADISELAVGTVLVLTNYPVNFAFIAGPTQPASNQWVAGQWVSQTGPPFIADILIGPNGLALSQGSYRIWCRVLAGQQEPVIPVGWLDIY